MGAPHWHWGGIYCYWLDFSAKPFEPWEPAFVFYNFCIFVFHVRSWLEMWLRAGCWWVWLQILASPGIRSLTPGTRGVLIIMIINDHNLYWWSQPPLSLLMIINWNLQVDPRNHSAKCGPPPFSPCHALQLIRQKVMVVKVRVPLVLRHRRKVFQVRPQ